MKKNILLLFLLLIGTTNIFAQTARESDWIPSLFVDLGFNYNSEVDYNNIVKIGTSKALAKSTVFEIGGGLDYILFDGIAICTSVKYHNNELLGDALKFGGGLKLLFSEEKYHHMSLELGYKKALGKSFFGDGGQIRIGYYWSVAKIKYLQVVAGLFYSYEGYNLTGDKTFYHDGYKCEYITFNSLGLSVGIAF